MGRYLISLRSLHRARAQHAERPCWELHLHLSCAINPCSVEEQTPSKLLQVVETKLIWDIGILPYSLSLKFLKEILPGFS